MCDYDNGFVYFVKGFVVRRETHSMAEEMNLQRSKSCDIGIEEYSYMRTELEKRFEVQKQELDKTLESQLVDLLPDLERKCDDTAFINAVHSYSDIIKSIINFKPNEMKQGKMNNIVNDLVQLQQAWLPSWPLHRPIITKTLLQISKFSRLINFLVYIYQFTFILLKYGIKY